MQILFSFILLFCVFLNCCSSLYSTNAISRHLQKKHEKKQKAYERNTELYKIHAQRRNAIELENQKLENQRRLKYDSDEAYNYNANVERAMVKNLEMQVEEQAKARENDYFYLNTQNISRNMFKGPGNFSKRVEQADNRYQNDPRLKSFRQNMGINSFRSVNVNSEKDMRKVINAEYERTGIAQDFSKLINKNNPELIKLIENNYIVTHDIHGDEKVVDNVEFGQAIGLFNYEPELAEKLTESLHREYQMLAESKIPTRTERQQENRLETARENAVRSSSQ